MYYALALVLSYGIGSIPVGYIIARLKGLDIRKYGSGNIGTTNVWRNLGPAYGGLTFVGDVLKGVLALMLGIYVGGQDFGLLCGLASIAGHSWPVFLGFKGGKIIATTTGVLLGISYQTALLALPVWLITIAVSRYVSLASMVTAVSVPIFMYLLDLNPHYIAFGVFAAAFAIFKHRSNIRRIIQGTEFKVGRGKRA